MSSGVGISVWIGGKERRVDAVTRHTTCDELVCRLLTVEVGDVVNPKTYGLFEQWRDVEKHLASRARVLRVWNAWGAEQKNVKFVLKKVSSSTYTGKSKKKKKMRSRRSSIRKLRTSRHSSSFSDDNSDVYAVCESRDESPRKNMSLEERVLAEDNVSDIAVVNEDIRTDHRGSYRQKRRDGRVKLTRSLSLPLNGISSWKDERRVVKPRRDPEVPVTRLEQFCEIVSSQEEQIEEQKRRIKEIEVQIEIYENKVHQTRMREDGKNYVQDTYLSDSADDSGSEWRCVSPRNVPDFTELLQNILAINDSIAQYDETIYNLSNVIARERQELKYQPLSAVHNELEAVRDEIRLCVHMHALKQKQHADLQKSWQMHEFELSRKREYFNYLMGALQDDTHPDDVDVGLLEDVETSSMLLENNDVIVDNGSNLPDVCSISFDDSDTQCPSDPPRGVNKPKQTTAEIFRDAINTNGDVITDTSDSSCAEITGLSTNVFEEQENVHSLDVGEAHASEPEEQERDQNTPELLTRLCEDFILKQSDVRVETPVFRTELIIDSSTLATTGSSQAKMAPLDSSAASSILSDVTKPTLTSWSSARQYESNNEELITSEHVNSVDGNQPAGILKTSVEQNNCVGTVGQSSRNFQGVWHSNIKNANSGFIAERLKEERLAKEQLLDFSTSDSSDTEGCGDSSQETWRNESKEFSTAEADVPEQISPIGTPISFRRNGPTRRSSRFLDNDSEQTRAVENGVQMETMSAVRSDDVTVSTSQIEQVDSFFRREETRLSSRSLDKLIDINRDLLHKNPSTYNSARQLVDGRHKGLNGTVAMAKPNETTSNKVVKDEIINWYARSRGGSTRNDNKHSQPHNGTALSSQNQLSASFIETSRNQRYGVKETTEVTGGFRNPATTGQSLLQHYASKYIPVYNQQTTDAILKHTLSPRTTFCIPKHALATSTPVQITNGSDLIMSSKSSFYKNTVAKGLYDSNGFQQRSFQFSQTEVAQRRTSPDEQGDGKIFHDNDCNSDDTGLSSLHSSEDATYLGLETLV